MLLTLAIRDVIAATPRARIVRLDLDGQSFPYAPGQAVFAAMHGYERRRPYSMASSPEDARVDNCLELLIGTDESGQPGPHLDLKPGARVDVEGPFGRFMFPEQPAERHFLFVAGGTGIAPLRAMLRHALTVPHDSIGLLYSARTPSDFGYEAELRDLARRGRIELIQTVTREAGTQDWSGTRGRISRGELSRLVHATTTLSFVCGPPTLVLEMRGLLDEIGISPDRVRTEEWT